MAEEALRAKKRQAASQDLPPGWLVDKKGQKPWEKEESKRARQDESKCEICGEYFSCCGWDGCQVQLCVQCDEPATCTDCETPWCERHSNRLRECVQCDGVLCRQCGASCGRCKRSFICQKETWKPMIGSFKCRQNMTECEGLDSYGCAHEAWLCEDCLEADSDSEIVCRRCRKEIE
mmetsp:Transcript_34435/g.80479  ORF Transcript_34435/g.80479 Transcript_34435/m.80479 type:complete len:177 (+) Transcript_34435:2-532(+)